MSYPVISSKSIPYLIPGGNKQSGGGKIWELWEDTSYNICSRKK